MREVPLLWDARDLLAARWASRAASRSPGSA